MSEQDIFCVIKNLFFSEIFSFKILVICEVLLLLNFIFFF